LGAGFSPLNLATHEAGHAVIGFILNFEITDVSIIPGVLPSGAPCNGSTGFVYRKLWLESWPELWERRMAFAYSGSWAESLSSGIPAAQIIGQRSDDMNTVASVCHEMGRGGASAVFINNLRLSAWITAEKLVDENQKLIHKLAAALVPRGRLNQHDAWEACWGQSGFWLSVWLFSVQNRFRFF
jgi:hypothetical protein